MKTALITGSESFGKYLVNPTKWLAMAADGKEIAGYRIHSIMVPSQVRLDPEIDDVGTTIIKKAEELAADVIVTFGLSSGVQGFQLERTGVNWVYDEKYCTSQENNRPLVAERPRKEKLQTDLTCLDFDKLQHLFAEAGVPCSKTISDNASQYSCNSWLYRTLLAIQTRQSAIPYLFFHTPCVQESIEFMPDFDLEHKLLLSKSDLLKGLEIILQSLKV